MDTHDEVEKWEEVIQAFRSLRGTSALLKDDWDLDFLRTQLSIAEQRGREGAVKEIKNAVRKNAEHFGNQDLGQICDEVLTKAHELASHQS